MRGNEVVDFIDIINVLKKRKWLIILGTLAVIIIVGVICFIIKPIYEISALIQPGKLMIQDQNGRFEEVVIESPRQVANRINEKTYDYDISKALNIPIKDLPKIKAEDIEDTFLVRILTKSNDIERGSNIIQTVIELIKKDLDEKVRAEISQIDISILELENKIKNQQIDINDKENEIKAKNLEIQSKEIEKNKINQEIVSIRNKIKISEDRMQSLIEEMKEIKTRIEKLEEEQRNALKLAKDDKTTLGMLLYSNEIQNNLRYYNSLEERLSVERINFENLNYSLGEKNQELRQIDVKINQLKTEIETLKNDIKRIMTEIETTRNDIKVLQEQKRRIDYTKIIKPAIPSVDPVFPKKKMMLALACIFGLVIFSTVAFFIDYIERTKNFALNKKNNKEV